MVSEAGKASGLQEATQHIFNEAGRKKIEDDFSSLLNFLEDYQSYLIKQVKKADAKKSWMEWLFREIFRKKRVMKDDVEWLKWQQDLHKPSQSVKKLLNR